MKILLINGPNLNLLGKREPEIYGEKTLADIERQLKELFSAGSHDLISFQSNHEGAIIDFLHDNLSADYAIINPGGLAHTSVSLRDALTGIAMPFIEVHISNVHAREKFRHHSYLSSIADGIILGCGVEGYRLAANLILQRFES
jgi:3-dehydroquinate dehydratase II